MGEQNLHQHQAIYLCLSGSLHRRKYEHENETLQKWISLPARQVHARRLRARSLLRAQLRTGEKTVEVKVLETQVEVKVEKTKVEFIVTTAWHICFSSMFAVLRVLFSGPAAAAAAAAASAFSSNTAVVDDPSAVTFSGFNFFH